MANIYRARVCAVGTEEDMLRLNRALLTNHDWLEESEDGPALKLSDLEQQVRRRAAWESGMDDGFVYDMIAPVTFGDATGGTCRYALRQEKCGLWTACFAYDSGTPFQAEDWLDLHRRCDRLPMVALRASEDFARDKGMLLLTGGQIQDDWSCMAETWLWLISQYECGFPPEEAVQRLEKLAAALEREEYDVTVAELLANCAEHLRRIGVPEDITSEDLRDSAARGDYAALFDMQVRVAETVLWETEHNARWLACLEAVQKAWLEAHDDAE